MFRIFQAVACIACFSFPVIADSNHQIRQTFLQAEKQLWKHNSPSYQDLYKQLHYYPLQPYLDQKRLMSRMRLSSSDEIASFLEEYKGTPLDWPLRKKWLNYLAKRNRQSMFLDFFQPTSDVRLTCLSYQYQLNKGVEPSVILANVDRLWVVGKSQPKACDPIFKLWQEAGKRTYEHVWSRLAKAADGGNHTLIPYITSLLPEKEQYLGKLWHKVRRDPAYITKFSRFPQKSAKETIIFTYGIKRLIWRDPNRALKTYEKAEKEFSFSEQQKESIALKFSLALASKQHKQADIWLAKLKDKQLTEHIVQWKIADVLRKQDWQLIEAELSSLPNAYQKTNQWKYWYGRTLLETGNKERAMAQLNELASKRHYYGFLAASLTGKQVNLQNKPLSFSKQEKAEIFKNSAGKRAFELFHLGRYHLARKEWNYWVRQLSDRQILGAAKLANEIGWYDRAIFALSQVGYLDDVELRFPLAFNDEINQYANKHDIAPAWAFAITRRESSFMSDAHSSAGAKGLMQVLPGTAKVLTRRKKITNSYLMDSENNINLGTKYLKELLHKHKGNQVLATAAYNAGPYRVKRWLKEAKGLPADIWIETIPFRETREYVKSVMAYQQIYLYQVGQPAQLFDQIHDMQIKRL